MKKNLTLDLLRIVALLVWAVGAGLSADLTFNAGHKNKSELLVILFMVWVLSPFVAILAAQAVFRTRQTMVRITVYCLMLFITLASLLGYSGALSPPGAKRAGVFLITPLLLWVVMLIAMRIALSRSRRNNHS